MQRFGHLEAAQAFLAPGSQARRMSRSDVGAGFAQLRGIRGMTLNVRTRALCDRLAHTMQTEAEDDDALLLVPLDGKLTLTFEAQDPVALAPGDGIAFPARERCQLAWAAPYGRGRVLLGHAQTPRSARLVKGMQNV